MLDFDVSSVDHSNDEVRTKIFYRWDLPRLEWLH